MAPIKSNSPFARYFDFFSKTGKDAVTPAPPIVLEASGGTKINYNNFKVTRNPLTICVDPMYSYE